MKKKTFIVLSSVVFTIFLVCILAYRLYLVNTDTSGFYEQQNTDWVTQWLTFMPEISIVLTLLAIYTKKRLGLTFTVLSAFSIVIALFLEFIIKYIKIATSGAVPISCIPWLNLPVLVIAIIIFIIKFRIYTLPSELKIKLKLVNLC